MHRLLLVVLLVASVASGAPKKKATKPVEPEAPKPEVTVDAPVAPAPVIEEKPAPIAVAPGEKPRLLVLGLSAAGGLDPSIATSFSETLTAQASKTGVFLVTSQAEISTALGVERQRELMGCSDGSSCFAELAGAMGAQFVMSGSLAKLGDAYQLNVQTLDMQSSRIVGRSTRIARSLESLRAGLAFVVAEATGTPAPEPTSKAMPITFISVGGVALVASGVIFMQSIFREQAALNELKLGAEQPTFTLRSASYYRDEASAVTQLRIIGGITAGLGAGLLITGLILFPKDDAPRVAVVPTFNGFAFAGVFP